MIVDALLVITLALVIISFFMKGKFRREDQNPVNRFLRKVYSPMIHWVMKWRKTTIAINVVALLISVPLLMRMGTEFMPPLDDGTILFMPVTLPDVSNTEINRILQVRSEEHTSELQ